MNGIEKMNHICDIIMRIDALSHGQTEDEYGFLIIDEHPSIMRRYSGYAPYDFVAEASKLDISRETELIDDLVRMMKRQNRKDGLYMLLTGERPEKKGGGR